MVIMAILLLDCLLASWGGKGGCYLLVCLLSWLGAAWQLLRFKETLLAGCRVRRSRSLVISYSACSTVWYLLVSDLLLTCLLGCYCFHLSPEWVLDNSCGHKTLLNLCRVPSSHYWTVNLLVALKEQPACSSGLLLLSCCVSEPRASCLMLCPTVSSLWSTYPSALE